MFAEGTVRGNLLLVRNCLHVVAVKFVRLTSPEDAHFTNHSSEFMALDRNHYHGRWQCDSYLLLRVSS
jgi:hypothetical protein